MTTTTIPVSHEVKDRLAQAKGAKSWNDFLAQIADELVDDAIAQAETRLEELKRQKARTFSLEEVRRERAARGKRA